ncbi:MAG: hypothetical protein ABIJ97_13155 [Bacteroidota bacterium]
MILIADSGSSKTDWALVEKGNIKFYCTNGLNPFYTDYETIVSELKKLKIDDFIKQIYFYGSGCANDEKNKIIELAISEVFPESRIFVNSDILGAARGLLQNKSGIAGIIGTGANNCLYDGNSIVYKGIALGYILGDDGSGAHLGKELIRAVFFKELPGNIIDEFMSTYNLSKDILLKNVYNESFPNRYLAGFAPFLKNHEENKDIIQIINKCLSAYFEKQIIKIPEYKKFRLSLTGSVAFHFSENIRNLAIKYSVDIHEIKQSPIEGLIEFHRQ